MCLAFSLAACGQSTPTPTSATTSAPIKTQQYSCDVPDPAADPNDPLVVQQPECYNNLNPAPAPLRVSTSDQVAALSPRAAYVVRVARDVDYYNEQQSQYFGPQYAQWIVLNNLFGGNIPDYAINDLAQHSSPYPNLNWSQDGCSAGPETYKDMFDNSCRLHDWAYRNISRIAREDAPSHYQRSLAQIDIDDSSLQKEVDEVFLNHMNDRCNVLWVPNICRAYAGGFYQGVRWFGYQHWSRGAFEWSLR